MTILTIWGTHVWLLFCMLKLGTMGYGLWLWSKLLISRKMLYIHRNCIFCLFRNISLNWLLHKMSILYWYTLYYKKLYLFKTLNNFLASATSTLSFSNSTFFILQLNALYRDKVGWKWSWSSIRNKAIWPWNKISAIFELYYETSRTLKTFWCMT